MHNKHNRLQWLAALTAVALIGIVSLQFYWLSISYAEQQSRFKADVDNLVMEAIIKSRFATAKLHQNDDETAGNSGDSVPAAITWMADFFAPVDIVSQNKRWLPVQTAGDSTGTQLISGIILNVNIDSLVLAPGKSYLNNLKFFLSAALRQRKMYIPAELAWVNSNNYLYQATCDTQVFKNIPVKSALSDLSLIAGNTRVRLQAAFPDAGLYVFRRMARVLIITIVLIIVGSGSFVLLLRLFFRQKRMADIRNDFMNNMTHELKTPIASVSIALEMMQKKLYQMSNETKSEYLSLARGELDRLSSLADKVLKMAALEKTEIQLAPETFDVKIWLQDILAGMGPLLEVSGATVTSDVQPAAASLYADKVHLTHVLQNLLENAIKYNDKKTPQISIDIRDAGDATILKVADNGKGIPAPYLHKVFDPFFRVPTGYQHAVKGYGLGLSYVKEVARLHGGWASASSRTGEGSEFSLLLPKGAVTIWKQV